MIRVDTNIIEKALCKYVTFGFLSILVSTCIPSTNAFAQSLATGHIHYPESYPVTDYRLLLTVELPSSANAESLYLDVSPSGFFEIGTADLESIVAPVGGIPGILTFEAYGYQAINRTVRLLVDDSSRVYTIIPDSFDLEVYPNFNFWFSLLLFFPLILGSGFSVGLHFLKSNDSALLFRYVKRYALGTSIVWSIITVLLVIAFPSWDISFIPLLSSRVLIPSGLVVFSFVGSIVYVSFSIYQRSESFFTEKNEKMKEKLLRVFAGRILIAPYIAIITYLIVLLIAPVMKTPVYAILYGFFTGLFIKPALAMINGFGKKLLSLEEIKKLAAREEESKQKQEAEIASEAGGGLLPSVSPQLMEAVNHARRDLMALEGVIGVRAGYKKSLSTGFRKEPAIVAYVYEKHNLLPDDPNLIPTHYRGFKTDVLPIPIAADGETCNASMAELSWATIHQDNLRQAGNAAIPTVRIDGNLIIIHDPDGFLFNEDATSQFGIFDPLGAFQLLFEHFGDSFEFIAFAIDTLSGISASSVNYYVPVFNSIDGTNHPFPSERDVWGSINLKACQVHVSLDPRTLLHELGHYWCAYVTYLKHGNGQSSPQFNLLMGDKNQERYHWGENFVDRGRSCMSRVDFEWIVDQQGNAIKRTIPLQEDYGYCNLDQYLMGLLADNGVGPLRILNNGHLESISLSQITNSVGERTPPPSDSPPDFRQTFVIITRDANTSTFSSGKSFREWVDEHRQRHALNFSTATNGRGSLDTDLPDSFQDTNPPV